MEYLIVLSFGIILGYSFKKDKPQEREEDKDFAYYKNLSASLMQDVRFLRQENKDLKTKLLEIE
jgi:hypothetical protein